MNLNQFIGKSQLSAMKAACRGEEGEFFKNMMEALKEKINRMPKTHETDGQDNSAMAILHYFKGASDWYIIEKDMEQEQIQAFGFVCLNGDKYNAELGYINIQELIQNNVEFDLYYAPEKILEIKKKMNN